MIAFGIRTFSHPSFPGSLRLLEVAHVLENEEHLQLRSQAIFNARLSNDGMTREETK